MAADYRPATTIQFQIMENPFGAMVRMASTRVPEEVRARDIRFAVDGFPIMTLPAMSEYVRMLTGQMGNTAFAKLDPDNKEKLWQAFLNAGVVTASASFGSFILPTEGFGLASADFEKCLGELAIISRRN
jgi:hypothetical protein